MLPPHIIIPEDCGSFNTKLHKYVPEAELIKQRFIHSKEIKEYKAHNLRLISEHLVDTHELRSQLKLLLARL
jgi:hypothetical protein